MKSDSGSNSVGSVFNLLGMTSLHQEREDSLGWMTSNEVVDTQITTEENTKSFHFIEKSFIHQDNDFFTTYLCTKNPFAVLRKFSSYVLLC